jgi:hypothetical protein
VQKNHSAANSTGTKGGACRPVLDSATKETDVKNKTTIAKRFDIIISKIKPDKIVGKEIIN